MADAPEDDLLISNCILLDANTPAL